MVLSSSYKIASRFFLFFLLILVYGNIFAQNDDDNLRGRHLYRPHKVIKQKKKNDQEKPPHETEKVEDSSQENYKFKRDSLELRKKYIQDSIKIREKFIRDSIAERRRFVRDSIIARQAFVRDSIMRRKRILDSLNLLKDELPRLLDASLKTTKDHFIIHSNKVKIIGDSILSNYTYITLPTAFNKPYTPWKSIINLSDNPIQFFADSRKKTITSIKTPFFDCTYDYFKGSKIVRINESSIIVSNKSKRYYKEPFDSVFFDNRGRVIKIKRYAQMFLATSNYQKGSPLFNYLSQVKQFSYNSRNQISKYSVVYFKDQWRKNETRVVQKIVDYSITSAGNTYKIVVKHEPENKFADGTQTYEFDNQYNLKSYSLKNTAGTENIKTIIELNEKGYVSRYVYKENGGVNRTLLIKYNFDNPRAKHKYELIYCTFGDDGISYYQKNATTNKSRTRDKMTLEWSDWK